MSARSPSSLFDGPSTAGRYPIRCLVPDLPLASQLLPYLERIDQNRWYTNFGPLLLEYESALAQLTQAHCVTLSSGTAALEIGIAALGLPPGSRVLLPSFAFPAPLLTALRCGLSPVLCDVSADAWTLTPEIALAALAHTQCQLVVPVATFGHPLPAEAWDRFARATGATVLMDAAGALGFQQVGTHAAATFSLHATKPLGIGEGGVFATPDGELAERVRRMTNYGLEQRVVSHAAGTNAKLSEFAAAVGLVQLGRREALFERRRTIWRLYRDALDRLPAVRIQAGFGDVPPAVLAVNLSPNATEGADALAADGIETRRWYHPPLHHHPLFAGLERVGPDGGTALPVTEDLSVRNLGLPFHTRLSGDDIARISDALAVSSRA